MSILTSLYDGLKGNQRIIDLGFGVLGGVISIVGTRALGIGIDKNKEYQEEENFQDFEDGIEDD
jgi:hypothetical protein